METAKIGILWGIVLLWSAFAFACGPEVPEKYLSFFSTQFIGYAPLTKSLRVLEYGDPHTTIPIAAYNENALPDNRYFTNSRDRANLLEWKAYLETDGIAWLENDRNNDNALAYVIYHFDPVMLADIQNYLHDHERYPIRTRMRETFEKFAIPSTEEYDFLSRIGSLFEAISTRQELVEYLVFAKACEIRAFQRSWDEREEFDPVAMRRLLEEGQARYATVGSEWLKMRYAYQVVRLARYLEDFETAIARYDELVTPLQVDSIIRYWALEHATASLCKLDRAAEASPLLARVFEHAPELRNTAYYCVDDDALANDTLTASLREKAILWTIRTLQHSGRLSFEPLRRVYALAPQSAFVESLLIRHLLDYEEAEFSRYLENPDNVALDTAYLAEFEHFALDATTRNPVRQPALWYLAAGYLRFMRAFADRGYADAAKLLQKAENAAGDDLQIRHQARLLRHVARLYQPGRITKKFTDALYPELQWLTDQGEIVIFQTVMTALGQKFLLQDDVPQAVCCFYAANNTILWPDASREDKHTMAHLVLDMYADANAAERLLAFMTQPSYSAFETFLLRYLPLTQDAVLDVWGTHLLRQHAFQRALRVFERIDPAYWERDNVCGESWEVGDFCVKQFQTSFFDNAHHTSDRFTALTKIEFTRQIVDLEQQARRDRAHADQYFWQIANAFYNTPYWGYAGVLWNGSLIWSYKYEYGAGLYRYNPNGNVLKEHGIAYPFNMPALKQAMRRREQVFRQTYGTQAVAMEYYQRALRVTKDSELAAETLAMLQECMIDPTMTSISSADFLPANADYFHRLHERYQQTAFHERLLDECPTFAAYVRENF